MLHRCCRPTHIEAATKLGVARVERVERITSYTVDGVSDPLAQLLRGENVNLRLELVCTTACLASSLGYIGEVARLRLGSIARVTLEVQDGIERLRVEGVEGELRSEKGVVNVVLWERFTPGELTRCVLGGAEVVAKRLNELLRQGVRLQGGNLREHYSLVKLAIGNELVKSIVSTLGVAKGECIEDVVTSKIVHTVYPLLAGLIAVMNFLERARIIYPVHPEALAVSENVKTLGHYGMGMLGVLARYHREASVIASKLAGTRIEIEPVRIDGSMAAVVRIEGERLRDPSDSPVASLALSVTAALLSRSSLLLAIDAPIEKLEKNTLVRELEKVNAVMLYSRF
ncbi:hypothetical protein Pyrfu_0892 [Pyrolobus fumarii 1A]|uniref:Uncharacterized protein n=1 Tax=Pyrolobus fumarii (strain DSM 11204 / 1A) TaxID=694429 RepID=G0EE67_PYRF1|nr:hypothetical protein [Pyrolobus fumarii]AEM38761.1 hypothetical protein Pyrfu_0892 [Pyrolobus fumarii 1A]